MEAVVYEAATTIHNGHQPLNKKSSESAIISKEKEDNSYYSYAVAPPPQEDEELMLENGFNRLPSTSPVDLQFENISFTAPLGFRKGM